MKNSFGNTNFQFGSILDYGLEAVPDKIAIQSGQNSITYRELHLQTNRVANFIAKKVTPGGHIGILAMNCIEYFELVIGCARAAVTVATINWRLSPREAANLALFNDCQLLFVHTGNPAWEKELETLLAGKLEIIPLTAPNGQPSPYHTLTAGESRDFSPVPVDPENVLFHIHTSGTTGTPKCIMHSHKSFISEMMCCRQIMAFHQDETFQSMSQLFHVASIGPYMELSAGGTVVLFQHFNADCYLSAVEKYHVTRLSVTPTVLKTLLCQIHKKHYDLTSVEIITYSTSPIPHPTLDDAMEQFPNCGFIQSYGMTEMGSIVTILSAEDHRKPDKLRSVGCCIPGCQIQIAGEHGEILPSGQTGEITIKGPSLLKGYYKRPELYDRYIRDGWLHTGDIGYLDDDGYLFLEGRKDDMIISGGENIYPKEIENRIMELSEDVSEAAVFGIPDEKWSEVPCACVVLQPGSSLTPAQIEQFLRGHLAHYKIPKRIELVQSLPKNAVGKVLKCELKKLYSNQRQE